MVVDQQVRQLQQMIGECDTKATGVAAGYDECAAALRDDFAKTLAAERSVLWSFFRFAVVAEHFILTVLRWTRWSVCRL